MEIDKIYNIDCLEGMKHIPDGSIDAVVTSPPYDNLRSYGGVGDGWNFETFKAIAKELTRILKDGGVIVWVVADATIDGSETGTSFRQALYFKDECGLNIHDTMIWAKDGGGAIGSNLSYTQNFEYMFVFSKGKPKTVNLIYDKPSQTYTGKAQHVRECRGGNDKGDRGNVTLTRLEMSRRNNWWYLVPQKEEGSDFHPAVYPLKLAREHIYSWTNESDTVLDPFMGSGTTAVACIKEKRHFIGFELNKQYFDKACQRIDAERRQLSLF